MEATDKDPGPDVVGRIMALEQRTRGLNGRLSALEMRLSGDASACDATEFVPAGTGPNTSLEGRVAALEAAAGSPPARRVSVLDVTGIVVGLSMLAVGVLLATGSVDLLRNPLLAFAGGIIVLGCAAWRLLAR